MKILICDDEKNQCDTLQKMILEHSSAHEITVFNSAEELFFECVNGYPFDCIFLDIQMKAMNGIDCARKIRESDSKINIIFLSAISDYVFEGYEVNAIRYLLKPLEKQKCFELLNLIETKISHKHYIFINQRKIDCDDIQYIESYGHYCCIHANDEIEVKTSLSSLSQQCPDYFIQTHRSYLVNLKFVEAVRKDCCILDDHLEIPISRSSLQKVNQAFMTFIKRGLYE